MSLHPNSLLTQMAEDQKDDKPIFVEGRWALMGATKDGFVAIIHTIQLVVLSFVWMGKLVDVIIHSFEQH